MSQKELIEAADTAVKTWVQHSMGWGPERVTITHVPHLSTPHFAFFVLRQRNLGAAGELYVMSDGQAVLPSNRENLAKVLAREGLPQHPDAIPAQQFAELFFKMAEVRPVHVLTNKDDQASQGLAQQKEFAPPTIQQHGDGVVATFWTSALKPARLEHWEVQIAGDGSVLARSEQVG